MYIVEWLAVVFKQDQAVKVTRMALHYNQEQKMQDKDKWMSSEGLAEVDHIIAGVGARTEVVWMGFRHQS